MAISWLTERHRKGWRNAFEAVLDLWRPEGPRDGWQLDEDGMTLVSISTGEWLIAGGEWLIAGGEIHARGGPRAINAYLLRPAGPFLTPGQRDWIAQVRARPLRLYRATDVQPGAGMTLVDELLGRRSRSSRIPRPVIRHDYNRSMCSWMRARVFSKGG